MFNQNVTTNPVRKLSGENAAGEQYGTPKKVIRRVVNVTNYSASPMNPSPTYNASPTTTTTTSTQKTDYSH